MTAETSVAPVLCGSMPGETRPAGGRLAAGSVTCQLLRRDGCTAYFAIGRRRDASGARRLPVTRRAVQLLRRTDGPSPQAIFLNPRGLSSDQPVGAFPPRLVARLIAQRSPAVATESPVRV